MANHALNPVLAELRERIGQLEGGAARARSVLPFAVLEIDRALPGGGLAFGALHEDAGGGGGSRRPQPHAGASAPCRPSGCRWQASGARGGWRN